MGTNLQRARWFGYRSKYIDICKIFTTSEISWDQFSDVENDIKLNIRNQLEEDYAQVSINVSVLAFKCKNVIICRRALEKIRCG